MLLWLGIVFFCERGLKSFSFLMYYYYVEEANINYEYYFKILHSRGVHGDVYLSLLK